MKRRLYLGLLFLLVSCAGANAMPQATAQPIKTVQPANSKLVITIYQQAFIPWNEQHFPKSYIELGTTISQPKAITWPLLRQGLDTRSILKSDSDHAVDVQTQRFYTVPSAAMVPLADGVIYLDVPFNYSANNIKPITIIKQDLNGATVWQTPTPTFSVEGKERYRLTADNGVIYFQYSLEPAGETTTVWKVDPATGTLTEVFKHQRVTSSEGELNRIKTFFSYQLVSISNQAIYWIDRPTLSQIVVMRYDLATQQSEIYGHIPNLDLNNRPDFITPLANQYLFFANGSNVVISDQMGNILLQTSVTDFSTNATPDLTQAVVQPDGSIIYPAVNEDGVYLLQATIQ